MTDKEKLHQILSSLEKNDDSFGKTYYNQALQDVQTAIDLQEEPVSKELNQAAEEYAKGEGLEDALGGWEDMSDAFKAGAQWQKEKDSNPSKDFEELINKLSGQFPEVSFAKLSRIAVRVAKWQRMQDIGLN